jgi:hypothetical protein
MFEHLLEQEILNLEDNPIFELSNANYATILEESDSLEELIFIQINKINQLDFSEEINRAFIFLLLDLCERLQKSGEFQILMNVINQQNIKIGNRLESACLFLTGISEAPQYIERFDEICDNLVNAIENEEDNSYKPLATFANYYLRVLSLHPQWIIILREKINESKNTYSFLSDEFIIQILSFSTVNRSECKQQIQQLKDELFYQHNPTRETLLVENEFLIEQNSNYTNLLYSLNNISFDNIRNIAVNQVGFGSRMNNRGVTPLISEEEMFIYMKSFGNMHYAKMMSALKKLSQETINGDIELIDWGCGQALATMVFGEYCNRNNISVNPNVILIEPSEIAIKRAALHTKLFFPNATIKTVCKYLDDVNQNYITTDPNKIKIHFFSNILDVELFSLIQLQNLISSSQNGINYFICVSPYINDLRTERVNSFMRYFQSNPSFTLLGNETNNKSNYNNYWHCNNNFRGCQCHNHLESVTNCQDKWTRVLKVFKVQL